MNRYSYVIIRCVPSPRTGEFVNIGAIAGSSEAGDWAVRGLSSERRARTLAGPSEISAAHDFMSQIGTEIDRSSALAEEGDGEPLSEEWLAQLHQDYRNVVQLSSPSIVLAESADAALQRLFEHVIIDPVSPQRTSVTKHGVLSGLRRSYRKAQIKEELIHQRVDFLVGEHVGSRVDFAIANGSTVQLTQGWSFQVSGIETVSTQVKSWGYAMSRLRNGDGARVVDLDSRIFDVPEGVDLQVVVVEPATPEQQRAYEEAQQVFEDLGVQVHDIGGVEAVARRAAGLLAISG
jgi:hypothetical protein